MLKKLKRYWRVFKYIYNQGAEGLDASRAMYDRIEKEGYLLYGNNTVHDSKIGRHSYIAHNSIIFNTDMGRYCSIGPNVVMGYGDHPTTRFSTSPHIYYNEALYGKETVERNKTDLNKRVTIKDDVWIGANVFIKNGITIGTGAVIGSGSIVLSDVGDYEIAVGVPARIIKKRFDEETIKKIKASKWWDYDLEQLVERKGNPDIQGLIQVGT